MDKGKRGVYLPVVWEQLPDKKLFLNSLKDKAGFYSEYFSNNMEVYKFTTEYISNNEEDYYEWFIKKICARFRHIFHKVFQIFYL